MGRHATNLELFLDLVFVLAITQIATLISGDLTASGVGKGVLIAFLVWWQWSQFTWAGSAIDLEHTTFSRVIVLGLIPIALLMSVSIPDAFGDTGVWFGATYVGVQTLVLVMQGHEAMQDRVRRGAYIRYTSFAAIAPIVVFVGAFFDGDVRVTLWVIGGALNLLAALRGAAGEWQIDPMHFSERHGLFIIIALGEVLIAMGLAGSDHGLERDIALAIVVGAAVACTMWWTYFAFMPLKVEHVLAETEGADRGRLARDVFTLGHFPLVVGLVFFAVVAKHLVAHPTGHLANEDRWLLGASVLCFVGGLMLIQLRADRSVAPERVGMVIAAPLMCLAGDQLDALVVVGGIAVLYAAMQAVTMHRLRRLSPVPERANTRPMPPPQHRPGV